MLRDPGVLLHAEFWGEDGWAWFPDAYNDGPASLLAPLAGYLQTTSRLVGLLSQAMPMAWAPTFFAVIAVAIQAAAPAFLVSDRMHVAWPSRAGRIAFALLWIALPNTREVYANLTNAQWHLALLAFLLLVATPPRSRATALADAGVLGLSGLSGPLCLLLLPVAAWQVTRKATRTALFRLAIMGGSAAIQGWTLLHTVGSRSAAPLGADPLLFARIVAQQVLLAPFTGQANMARLQAFAVWQSGLLPVATVLAAVAVCVYAAWRGPPALRSAGAFGLLVLAASLLRPQVSASGDQWYLMQGPGVGQRYWFVPMLAWLATLCWLISPRASLAHPTLAHPTLARLAAIPFVAALLFGTTADYFIPPRQPTGFSKLAARFQLLPPGGAMAFPINPLMDQVPMILIRHPAPP